MKEIFKTPKTFEAYSTIDYCLFAIKKTQDNLKNRTTLDIMIDTSTGNDISMYEDICNLIGIIIKNKKIIGSETISDERMLAQCKNKIKKIKKLRNK